MFYLGIRKLFSFIKLLYPDECLFLLCLSSSKSFGEVEFSEYWSRDDEAIPSEDDDISDDDDGTYFV